MQLSDLFTMLVLRVGMSENYGCLPVVNVDSFHNGMRKTNYPVGITAQLRIMYIMSSLFLFPETHFRARKTVERIRYYSVNIFSDDSSKIMGTRFECLQF